MEKCRCHVKWNQIVNYICLHYSYTLETVIIAWNQRYVHKCQLLLASYECVLQFSYKAAAPLPMSSHTVPENSDLPEQLFRRDRDRGQLARASSHTFLPTICPKLEVVLEPYCLAWLCTQKGHRRSAPCSISSHFAIAKVAKVPHTYPILSMILAII